ncbi:hypothetical protein FHT70_000609 [Rhizobium sp. BK049]|nr:hypothetical protein [Rhizobium sp. BK049]
MRFSSVFYNLCLRCINAAVRVLLGSKVFLGPRRLHWILRVNIVNL